jgi:hypothetical protein
MSDHKGKVVSVTGQTLNMTDCDGSNPHSHSVPTSADVTLNGDDSSLDKLLAGDEITVCGDPITSIEATRDDCGP